MHDIMNYHQPNVHVIDFSQEADEPLLAILKNNNLQASTYSRDADTGLIKLKQSINEQHPPCFCLICLGSELPKQLEEFVAFIQVELTCNAALFLRSEELDSERLLWQECLPPILTENMAAPILRSHIATLVNTSKLNQQSYQTELLVDSLQEKIEDSVSKRTVKLEANLEFLENLVSSIPLPIFYRDTEGKFLGCNRSFGHYIGRLPHEIVGLNTSDIMDSLLVTKFDRFDDKILQDGITRSYEEQVRYVDGSDRHILFEKAAFYNSHGAMSGVIGLMLDITSRKKTEESLNNEHRLLRTVIDLIPEAIYAKDAHCSFILANKTVADLMGQDSPENLIGKQDADFYPVELWAPYYSAENKVIKTGESMINSEELCMDLKTHQRRWLMTTKVPLRDTYGNINGVVGIGRDVTEKKILEDQLLELKNIVNHSRTVAFLLRANDAMSIEFVSDNVEQFGFSAEELYQSNASFRQLIFEKDRNKVIQLLENNRSISLNKFIHEYRIVTPTGDACWVEDHTYIRSDSKGKVTHYQCVISDISWKKKAEEEKNRLEVQLRQSQKLEAIGELAAGIAHEINTPIQFIGDNTRFLLGAVTDILSFIQTAKSLNAETQEHDIKQTLEDLHAIAEDIDLDYLIEEFPAALNQSLDGVKRVSDIVVAMKEFSHPGTKDRQAIDINKAVINTMTVARNEWKYCSDVETHLDEDIPMVSCYAGKMNQVLLNLLVNAAHAIITRQKTEQSQEKGKILITTSKNDQYVIIEIKDSGTGIPESARDRIFEPFFTTKEVGKGTGQGLAIAYDVVVRNHKGKLYFKTEEGVGTSFFVELPIHQGAIQQSPSPKEQTSAV